MNKELKKHLSEFGIHGCHVRKSNIIAFSTQKWVVDDSLEPRPTMFFFYNPTREKKDQWAARGWDQVTGVHGSACFKPKERWIFISDPGEVYVIGQGDDGDEAPITKSERCYFTALKCIAGGNVYAVGLRRRVYKRTRPNVWKAFHTESMTKEKGNDNIGFSDIDGFSDREVYACGGAGDLWRFDGKSWKSLDVPTNASLEKICCAGDGKVYITTNANLLLIGRDAEWEIKEQDVDLSEAPIEEIVYYDERVFVSSYEQIYELKDGELTESDLSIPKMDSYAHMAAGDGILVVGGIHSASLYDGTRWSRIYDLS